MKKIEVLFVLILMLGLVSCKQDVAGPPDTAASVAPTINQHPSDVTLVVGQTATFTVSATGTAPLSYQWKKHGDNIAGATSDSYTFSVTSADSGKEFRCVVANAAGSATSNRAVLNVVPVPVAPTITVQPVSQTVVSPGPATFTVSATGTAPLSYQWQTLSGGSWTNVPGATNFRITFDSTDYGQSGMQLCCKVSNSAGSATSDPVTLTVGIALGSNYLGGKVISLSFDGSTPRGLIAAKHDQSRGVLTTPQERQQLCAAYGAEYRLPADTTELRLLKVAKDAGLVKNFISPQNAPEGFYISSMAELYQGQPIVLVLALNLNYERFGWAPANTSLNVRAVRSF